MSDLASCLFEKKNIIVANVLGYVQSSHINELILESLAHETNGGSVFYRSLYITLKNMPNPLSQLKVARNMSMDAFVSVYSIHFTCIYTHYDSIHICTHTCLSIFSLELSRYLLKVSSVYICMTLCKSGISLSIVFILPLTNYRLKINQYILSIYSIDDMCIHCIH